MNGNSEEFLIAEYESIVQAHFKSIETITGFFRYYLLLTAVPLAISSAVLSLNLANLGAGTSFNALVQLIDAILPITFLFVALVGLGVMWYLCNLRHDVVLYARAINAIRRAFFEKHEGSLESKNRIIILPRSSAIPAYHEMGYFYPVVLVFALVNSAYMGLGQFLLNGFSYSVVTLPVIYFCLHLFVYFRLSSYREHGYLRSNIMGVDIDGVLNQHRDQFCKIYNVNTGKQIRPDQLTHIPVSNVPGLGISRGEEYAVFNEPKYWTGMPADQTAVENVKKICNTFHVRIHYFTHRPWPMSSTSTEQNQIRRRFAREYLAWKFSDSSNSEVGILHSFIRDYFPGPSIPLNAITKEWLRRNNFFLGQNTKLYVERSGDTISDPRCKTRNRFYMARKKAFRFFVEDDLIKAVKLSAFCEVVFLISHPYNTSSPTLEAEENERRDSLPTNLIRVRDWKDIYDKLKSLA
jgi:hypothetical protein